MTMAALHAKSDTDAAIDLNQEVIELLAAFPGIETLTGLVAIDPANLSRSGRIDYLAALERQSAWL